MSVSKCDVRFRLILQEEILEEGFTESILYLHWKGLLLSPSQDLGLENQEYDQALEKR